MAKHPMIGISGIRGIVGETLFAEDFVNYALGLGTLVGGGTVLVGRDPRHSGEMIRDLVCGALLSTGCRVVDRRPLLPGGRLLDCKRCCI